MLKLYDLAMADSDIRPSPWCWLAKFALLHKGAEFETIPLRFTEKHNYPDPEHGKLPILVSGDEVICDSMAICAWAEKNLPGEPLTATGAERAAADFYLAWLSAEVFPALAPPIIVKVWQAAHADDLDYFRTSREERYGKTLEDLSETPGVRVQMEKALQTLAAPLARHKFLGGEKPFLADYIVMGVFMWQHIVTSDALYETPQSVDAWKERMFDLYDGYARKAKRVSE